MAKKKLNPWIPPLAVGIILKFIPQVQIVGNSIFHLFGTETTYDFGSIGLVIIVVSLVMLGITYLKHKE